MRFLPAQLLVCYRNFKAIEANNFHGIIRYYEQHEEDINALDFDAYFDCLLVYTNALFQTGAYGKHVVMSNVVLETIIMENIVNWGGEDCYGKMLFRKAASLFYLEEYQKAAHVLGEMVKLYPENKSACHFLHKCLHRYKPGWLTQTRAGAVVIFILSVFFAVAYILFIKPFAANYAGLAERCYYCIFALGALVFCAGELIQYLRCSYTVSKTKQSGLLRKQMTE